MKTMSEAQYAANKKWDKANYSQIRAVADKDLIAEFKQIVQSEGKTINGTLVEFIREYVTTHGKG